MLGHPIKNCPESLRLFMLSEATGNHLPCDGGLYDQHPHLLEDWFTILQARGAHDRKERAKQDQLNKRAAGAGRGRRRR